MSAQGGSFVGIDVGGTKMHVAVSDADGRILSEALVRTEVSDKRPLVEGIRDTISGVLAKAHVSAAEVAGVGVGVAGIVDPATGELRMAPNLAGLHASDISREIATILDAPVQVENDVNLAALGEWSDGHARGLTDFVFVAVGTGIGMGIIAAGQLVRGARRAAGEIGYLPFGADPFDSVNHVRGPLEEVVAGGQIAVRYQDATGHRVSTRDVFDLARHGDSTAEDSLDLEARYVARSLAAVRAVLDPSLVVLGGGVGSRPELRALMLPWLERLGCGDLDVRTSALGADASLRGALRLARLPAPPGD